MQSRSVYPRILGADWEKLHPLVRKLHDQKQMVSAKGLFSVTWSDRWLARLLAWVGGLPSPGDNVAVDLAIRPTTWGEEWLRRFAGKPLFTRQWMRSRDILVEQIGPLQVDFRLFVQDGGLEFQSLSSAFGFGRFSFSLPRWFSLGIVARESYSGHDNMLYVYVDLQLPWIGRIVTYRGTLLQQEEH